MNLVLLLPLLPSESWDTPPTPFSFQNFYTDRQHATEVQQPRCEYTVYKRTLPQLSLSHIASTGRFNVFLIQTTLAPHFSSPNRPHLIHCTSHSPSPFCPSCPFFSSCSWLIRGQSAVSPLVMSHFFLHPKLWSRVRDCPEAISLLYRSGGVLADPTSYLC